MDRRRFFKWGLGGLTALGIYGFGRSLIPNIFEKESEQSTKEKFKSIDKETIRDEFTIPKRELGNTGLKVTIFSLGGEAALLDPDKEREAEEIIIEALESGINYIDTAPLYGDGLSETNIGKVLPDYRENVVLATKSYERSYDETMRSFEQSLRRLQTDYIDIYQIHSIMDEEDMSNVLADDGVLKAMDELKSNGDINFIGATSHYDPKVLTKVVDEYDFDTVLINLNPADVHQNSFKEQFLPKAQEKNLGITGMKVLSKGRMLREDGISSMEDALSYVLSLPVTNAIVGISEIDQLRENIEIVKNFQPLSKSRMRELEELAGSYSEELNWYR